PTLNAGEVELLDLPKLQEQLLTLVVRGGRIDHQAGDHDDWANAASGTIWLVRESKRFEQEIPIFAGPFGPIFTPYPDSLGPSAENPGLISRLQSPQNPWGPV